MEQRFPKLSTAFLCSFQGPNLWHSKYTLPSKGFSGSTFYTMYNTLRLNWKKIVQISRHRLLVLHARTQFLGQSIIQLHGRAVVINVQEFLDISFVAKLTEVQTFWSFQKSETGFLNKKNI